MSPMTEKELLMWNGGIPPITVGNGLSSSSSSISNVSPSTTFSYLDALNLK